MSGIPSWAIRGRKVVCIDVSDHGKGPCPLALGAVYTVEWAGKRSTDTSYCIIVAEYREDWRPGIPYGYNIARFRPAVEDSDENGIEAQFYHKRGLKSKSPVRESADA